MTALYSPPSPSCSIGNGIIAEKEEETGQVEVDSRKLQPGLGEFRVCYYLTDEARESPGNQVTGSTSQNGSS
jgi:hypothetical protein